AASTPLPPATALATMWVNGRVAEAASSGLNFCGRSFPGSPRRRFRAELAPGNDQAVLVERVGFTGLSRSCHRKYARELRIGVDDQSQRAAHDAVIIA